MLMLAEHLGDRGLTGSDSEALLFASQEGAALHYGNWQRRVWVPAIAVAELEGLAFHDLKHRAGTALVAAGVHVRTAQFRLGQPTRRRPCGHTPKQPNVATERPPTR
jgi:site-specific recombinase XerC